MLYYKFCKLSDISEISIDCALKLLSSEQSRYINSLVESKRKQSVCVRALLNLMLNEYFDNLNVSSLSFNNNSKPYLENSNLHISLTHSAEYVGCAVSDRPVGIDIEKVREVKCPVVNRVCSVEEIEFIKDDSDFFTLWTLKEAFIKANNFKSCRLKELNFVKNKKLFSENCSFITNELDGYKWSVVNLT